MKTLLLAALFFSANAFATDVKPCEVIAKWASIITVTCPKDTDNSTLAKIAYKVQSDFSDGEMRKILFFSERRLTPRNNRQFGKMSDSSYARVFSGEVTYNGPNGFKEFRCKLSAEKVGNCTALLK